MKVCCSVVSVCPNIRDSFITRLDSTRPSAGHVQQVLNHSEALFTSSLLDNEQEPKLPHVKNSFSPSVIELNSHISLLILTPQKKREQSQPNISGDTQPPNTYVLILRFYFYSACMCVMKLNGLIHVRKQLLLCALSSITLKASSL